MPVEGYIRKKQSETTQKNNNSTNNKNSRATTAKKKNNFDEIKNEIVVRVRQRVINKYKSEDLDDEQKMDEITKQAVNMIEEESSSIEGGVYLDSQEKTQILEKLIFTMFGYGVLDPLIKDPSITEIMVNGLDNIFIEKSGKLVIAADSKGNNLKFDTPDELLYVVEKIVAPINRKIDDSNPIVDARLPNGFRVNIVLNVISLDGTIITIRKFPENPFTMDDLVGKNSVPQEVADFLKRLVKARYNLFVSGGTGSGKTTFLNALSNFINRDERVITIEDSAELKIMGVKNLIRLETRPANVEGKGAITMRDLLKSALRMRPDRIVVGEVRSGEALEMLQAMNTGHDGSLSTGHANSAADMLSRLETMVLMAGVELPLLSIRQQIASAIELIVHLGKLRDGTRRVLQITEILGVTAEGYITSDLFKFDPIKNKLLYTGNKLKQTHKLKFAKKNGEEVILGRVSVTSSFSIPRSDKDANNNEEEDANIFSRFLKTKSDVKKTVKEDSIFDKIEEKTVADKLQEKKPKVVGSNKKANSQKTTPKKKAKSNNAKPAENKKLESSNKLTKKPIKKKQQQDEESDDFLTDMQDEMLPQLKKVSDTSKDRKNLMGTHLHGDPEHRYSNILAQLAEEDEDDFVTTKQNTINKKIKQPKPKDDEEEGEEDSFSFNIRKLIDN